MHLVRQKGHVFQKCSQWMQLHSMVAFNICILTCTKVFDLKRHSCLKNIRDIVVGSKIPIMSVGAISTFLTGVLKQEGKNRLSKQILDICKSKGVGGQWFYKIVYILDISF